MPFAYSFMLHLIQSNCEPQPKDEGIFPLIQHSLLLPLVGNGNITVSLLVSLRLH